MSELKKSRGVGIALSYVYTFANMIVGLFLSAFLLRMLGDTEYGIYKTVSSFVNYLVLLEFGMGTVLVRNLSVARGKNADKAELERNISTIWLITNILSLLIILVSVVFYFLMDTIYSNSLTAEQLEYGKKIFIIMTVHLVFSFCSQTLNKIPLAFENYTYHSILSIAALSLRLVLLIALLIPFKYSIVIAFVDSLISIIMSVFAYLYSKRKYKIKINFRGFDKSIFKASLPLCIAIFLQVVVNQANSNVDNFIIGIVMGPEAVTVYSVGLYIYSIFSSLTTIPISMYSPQVTKAITRDINKDELLEILIRPSRFILIVGGAVFFGFFAVGKPFITLLYGAEYLEAWLIAIIIMFPMLINMSNGILVNVLDATNKRMARSIALILTTVANIILTIFWIKSWGIIGAAVATAICTFVGQITLMNIYYAKVLGIRVLYMYYRTVKGILPYQFLGAIVAYFVCGFITNQFVALFTGGIIFVSIFFGLYLIFGKTKEEKEMFGKVINKFKRKCFKGESQ